MNAVARIAPGLPAMSQGLDTALAAVARNADVDALHRLPVIANGHVQAEARRRADLLAEFLRPATAATIEDWLFHLSALVANLPADYEAKAAAMAGMLAADMPRACFTPDTLREMARATKWWPSLAEVEAVLAPVARKLRREVANLRAVCGALEAPPAPRGPHPAMTLPDAASVASQVAELKQHVAAEEARRAPPRLMARARPLTPQHLIAAYEIVAQNPDPKVAAPAIHRLESLRRQVGA